MRWLWSRRKLARLPTTDPERAAPDARPHTSLPDPVHPREPAGEELRLARDYLLARRARVRLEPDGSLTATFPDGGSAGYTTSAARARAQDDIQLLVEGSAALAALLDDVHSRARVSALRLGATGTAADLALGLLAAPPVACGQCIASERSAARGVPSCAACPLAAQRWAFGQPTVKPRAEVVRTSLGTSIELVFQLTGRDRYTRQSDWIRLAFDDAGESVGTLDATLLAHATAVPLSDTAAGGAAAALERARAALAPTLAAEGALLRQRSSDEYRRRVVDAVATHEQLRHEHAEDTSREADTALRRELATLAKVHGVEVEACLERLCWIESPLATVAVCWGESPPLELEVDLGRGTVRPPRCAICARPARSGHVCTHAHLTCSACAEVCAHCGRARCALCAEPTYVACAFCGDALCPRCARACEQCRQPCCPAHTWPCAQCGTVHCIACVAVCAHCAQVVCGAHARICGECHAALCAEHARQCAECGGTRCEDHARSCAVCGQTLCTQHLTRCARCGGPTCATHTFACLGCGLSLCSCSTPRACRGCGALYCSSCLGGTGACPACRSLAPADEAALALLGRAAGHMSAPAQHAAWLTGHNASATVYVARGVGRRTVYIVSPRGEVLSTHMKGWRGR